MRRLFLVGIAGIVLTSATCIAAEPNYDAGTFYDQADRIELNARKSINKAVAPDDVYQIIGKAQMEYSQILIRQNNEMIRQNSELIHQNNEIIRLLRKIPKQ